jgi:Xaa-Pro aminopeptidase
MKLKYDFEDFGAGWSPPVLSETVRRLDEWMTDLDALILTSKDPFLSEYVPQQNNPRYGATRFTGSVGDALFFSSAFRKKHPELAPFELFVDGRYHLQADRETDPAWVRVWKLDVEPNIERGVQRALSRFPGIRVGMDLERTSVASLKRYRESLRSHLGTVSPVEGQRILEALDLPGWQVSRPIRSLSQSVTGRSIAGTCGAIQDAMQEVSGHTENLFVTAATDDAAFLLNARGYHLPHHSSFLAYTFLSGSNLCVFLPSFSKDSPVDLDRDQCGGIEVSIIRDNLTELQSWLARQRVRAIHFNGTAMNALLPELATVAFPTATVNPEFKKLLMLRTRKTREEMESIRNSFLRSSRAIARTLRFGKAESQKRNVSEFELADYLKESYADEGAVALSFKTISGAAGNSAIVHYSSPSKDQFFRTGQLALLDSGAYYSEGFATDCTRGFFVGGASDSVRPEPWQKEIYTATLKAAIQVFLAPVDARLSGQQVDAWIRSKVNDYGYDYLHGTGHGIGIHVHEEGIRLSTLSVYPQSPYACVSVEPGIYLENRGGVRVENVALLIPEGEVSYRYENVVWVGYDWDLIDLAQLNDAERSYLKAYEAKCRELGTHLTECPL